eukprot:g6311.t1
MKKLKLGDGAGSVTNRALPGVGSRLFSDALGPFEGSDCFAENTAKRPSRRQGREAVRWSCLSSRSGQGQAWLTQRGGQVFKQDLSYVGLLGVGGFSKVELWQHMVSGTTYALKSIDKGLVMHYNMEDETVQCKR